MLVLSSPEATHHDESDPFLVLANLSSVQTPTGTIAGVVRDSSGAVVSARVKAVSVVTGLVRAAVTSEQGSYSFPALMAGEYSISVEEPGFQTVNRPVSGETGATTTLDFALQVGDVAEAINVDGASPQMRYDSHTVGGSISRRQIVRPKKSSLCPPKMVSAARNRVFHHAALQL